MLKRHRYGMWTAGGTIRGYLVSQSVCAGCNLGRWRVFGGYGSLRRNLVAFALDAWVRFGGCPR